MKKNIFLMLVLLTVQFSYAQHNPLKITVTNINKLEGNIQVSLYNKETSFIKKGLEYKTMTRAVKSATEVFTFNDLPEGEYAVALYHDENSDGKCNTNFLGIPKEGYAFSKNFVPKLAAPKFEDTKFKQEHGRSLVIKMIY
ncbi:DUF2141 domain-containing protein [Pedobacter gandavensis]|uniref:DUF2141 domain-containing protein n=1 Tax=Pedobacter gandavensis TaxID=2679963 RepID=UPI00292F6E2B|nr:DUF2141 domain-containing protein [Pedobacter gandavensis]